MESTARERAATTRHRDTSSPQLLLIFSGSPLPSTQRLKIDLKLKWSICNTSFLPIPPQGTETFHKNPTKHPTYALTSPCRFLIPRCTHASKRKFPPAPFSFYVLRLGSRFPSGATLLPVPRGAAPSLLLFSHNRKQIPCAAPPCCSADWEGSDFCHLKLTLGKVTQQQQTDLQIQCRENLSVLLKPQPSQCPECMGWVLKDAEHFLTSLTWWDLGVLSQGNEDLSPQHCEWRTPLGFFFFMNF